MSKIKLKLKFKGVRLRNNDRSQNKIPITPKRCTVQMDRIDMRLKSTEGPLFNNKLSIFSNRLNHLQFLQKAYKEEFHLLDEHFLHKKTNWECVY